MKRNSAHVLSLGVLAMALAHTYVHAGGNLLLRNPADASTHFEQKWPDQMLPIQWYLSTDGLPASGITNSELEVVLGQAFAAWEQLPTSRLRFVYAGELDAREAGIDGVNLVTFTDSEFVFPHDVLAVAVVSSFPQDTLITDLNNDLDGDGTPDIPNGFYPAGSIYDADIVFNATNPLAVSGLDGTLDIQAVALHEVGHTFGLAHSVIEDAVMYPFLSSDIADARTLHTDDIAYASEFYPDQPAYGAAFGSVSGRIASGLDGVRVLGAHVYALDPATGSKIVGGYSLEQGDYRIPGLPPGSYYIGTEPLDGEPRAADPARINPVIAATFDTNFPEEFYDANESSIETDPLNVLPVNVVAGVDASGIDMVTNTVEIPGASISLSDGLNLFSYPVSAPTGMLAFDLLAALGDVTEINSIDRYDTANGRFERATWIDGAPGGDNFRIVRGEGYLVHMNVEKTVSFSGSQDCPALDLADGFNLIGVPCPPAGYSAFDLLQSLGDDLEVSMVRRYDPITETHEEARYEDGGTVGSNFVIRNGEAYQVQMLTAKQTVVVPGQNQIFPPLLNGVTPGRGVPGATVLLLGQGFSTDAAQNDVRFNGVRAAVTFATAASLTVTVPSGASSGPVNVSIGNRVSNSVNFIVEAPVTAETPGVDQELVSGQRVDGHLDTGTEQDRYTFIALAGSVVTIEANAVNPGVPDLLLFLEGPSGAVLASDDNSGAGANARINNFELPETGVYTVVVTSVPNTGTGAYQLSIDIDTRTTAPQISVIEGQFQSGLAGTELPIPIRILVTGPSGAPVAGIPISFTTDDDTVGVNPEGYTAATFTSTSNASGLATISVLLPISPGVYPIRIQVPGQPPANIWVSGLSAAPALVEIIGNNQDCGGLGCTVGELLPQPYQLRFLDIGGEPVSGVLAKFEVVSGGGSLENHVPAETGHALGFENYQVTGVDGRVEVSHRLGTRLYHQDTTQPIPQLVAAVASIPQHSGPILFGATAKASTPAAIDSRKTRFSRMSIASSRLNAVRIRVTDAYGNPVQGATVTMNGGGLLTAPGLLDGAFLPDMRTNIDGEFVGMVTAPISVAPTIDEFGASAGAGSYSVTTSVVGASGSLTNHIEVDMGPDLLGTTSLGGADAGESQWVGRILGRPVTMILRRMQRTDTCEDLDGDGNDDDAGVWIDEDFDPTIIRSVPVPAVALSYTALRDDGRSDNPAPSVTPSAGMTNGGGYIQTQLTMGNSRGGNTVRASTGGTFPVPFSNDSSCIGSGTYDNIPFPTAVFHTSMYGPLDNSRSFTAASPEVTVTLRDNVVSYQGGEVILVEPSPDPYPGRSGFSGIDIATMNILLNGESILDGATVGGVETGGFPHYESLVLDGGALGAINGDALRMLRPGILKYVYYPTADQLSEGQNTVRIEIFKDGAGHELENPVIQIFTLP